MSVGSGSRPHRCKPVQLEGTSPSADCGSQGRRTRAELTGETMTKVLWRLLHESDGQDLIEYGLLAGFISLVAILAITNVGTALNGVWNNVDAQMGAAAASAS